MFGGLRRPGLIYLEPLRVVVVIAAIVGTIFIVGSLGYADLPFLIDIMPLLIRGGAITILATLVILPISLVVGFLVGWARISRNPLGYWTSTLFVEVFRGTPQLVLLLVTAFIVLPLAVRGGDVRVVAFWLGSLALAFHSAAYQAEIFRAGFQSVPTGQIEAAHALGLDSWGTMRTIVLPQAFRVSLPALGNEFANVVKDSAILVALGELCIIFLCSFDVTGWGRQLAGIPFNVNTSIFLWIVIAAFYFVVIYILSAIMLAVERSLRVPGLEEGL